VRHGIEVSRRLWGLSVDDTVVLTLGDGSEVTLTVVKTDPLSGRDLATRRLHVELQELTPRLAQALRLPYTRGLVISGVEEGAALQRRGVQRGDVIIQIGNRPLSTFDDLGRALNDSRPGDVVDLIIDRAHTVGTNIIIRRFIVAVSL
jgi:S1-C subfamily serine protease